MTKQRKDDRGDPWEGWRRNKHELSSAQFDYEDLDGIWHDFINGRMMIIETKTNMALPTFAQCDTHSIIHQVLKNGFQQPLLYFKRIGWNRPKKIQYYGYFLVQFEKTTPLDGKIYVNGVEHTEQEFTDMLCFQKFKVPSLEHENFIELCKKS